MTLNNLVTVRIDDFKTLRGYAIVGSMINFEHLVYTN